MKLSAMLNEENKDKQIEINFSLTRGYINELLESKWFGMVQLTYIKDKDGTFYEIIKERDQFKFTFKDLTVIHGKDRVFRTLHELDFERGINEKRTIIEYLSLQNRRKLTEEEGKDFYEGLDHLKKRLGDKNPTFSDKIYLLEGYRNLNCGYRGNEGCPGQSLIFSSLKKAIQYIEDYEIDKENYHCWNCDYELEEKERYDNLEFTDDNFKNKQCPYCKKTIDYSPEWFRFGIYEYKLNKEYIKSLYGCEYDDKKKQIKERFGESGEFTYRKITTKILDQEIKNEF